MKLFDTHVHLEGKKFDCDRDDIIKAFKEHNVDKVISVASNMETSTECIKLANKYKDVYATVGIHPHDATKMQDEDITTLEQLAKENKVVAIGEIGLDYHYDFSPRDVQMQVLEKQLNLAKRIDLPVIYHVREAFGDFLPMVQNGTAVRRAVMHCYGGSKESAKVCLDAGMMISFTGVITFKNAHKVREVVEYIPLDRLLIETDCPYMSPVPYRGKRNEPAYVVEVARAIADIKKLTLEEVAKVTYNNAINFFGIK